MPPFFLKIFTVIKRQCQRKRQARIWSNSETAKFAPFFAGRVINVSGWKDEDKQGRLYQNYFTNAKEYFVSNIEGDKGLSGLLNEIYLDLEKPLAQELQKSFDVVFCHTTLEHIFNIQKAFDNLCLLSKDIVILIVPFLQEQHWTESFGDYWRFTPQGIIRNFRERGFEVLYLSQTPYKNNPIYLFAVGTCNFAKWQEKFSPFQITNGVLDNFAKPKWYCSLIQKIHVKH
ncbi:MAG: hypothetical protein PHW31_03255 [Candidatus Pacebacteria bacterium]|nr:hypothetical protein [Candidatus Paceibacterota bacterium]